MDQITLQARRVFRRQTNGEVRHLSLKEILSLDDDLRRYQHLYERLRDVQTERQAINALIRTLCESGYDDIRNHFFIFVYEGTSISYIETSFPIECFQPSLWEKPFSSLLASLQRKKTSSLD